MTRGYIVAVLSVATFVPMGGLISSIYDHSWESATTYATLFVGFIAAGVVIWQGYLIKQQLAFSTYLELDKEWNSKDVIELRQMVHVSGSREWDYSRLEGILEFFEKLASLFEVSGDMSFVCQSTPGWYAAHYFLFAREHGQIKYLRDLWKDRIYQDLESFYSVYLDGEVGRDGGDRRTWELERLETETSFWEQERKD